MNKQVNPTAAYMISMNLYYQLAYELDKNGFKFFFTMNDYSHLIVEIEDKYFIECCSGLYKDVNFHYAFRLKGARRFKHGYNLQEVIERLLGEIKNEK